MTSMKRNLTPWLLLGCLALLGVAGGVANGMQTDDAVVEPPVKQCLRPNEPVGTARGIFPGRVAWSHAPGAARWDEGESFWFDDRFNSQEDCDWLVEQILCTLAGTRDAKAAWKALFAYFNTTRGRGEAGYRTGERIAIKVNNNNTYSHADSPEINASPQLLLALLKSLIRDGGVPQECITVAEPSRFITDFLFDKCHTAFPEVRFVDNQGGDGRIKAAYEPEAMRYSRDNGQLARGVATAFTEATYVINMALLKGHVGQGVTLCGKNWYGAMSIHADWRKNFHNNFNQSPDGQPKYITFVDFMGHKDLGGKGLLWLIDGLYGSRSVDGVPSPRWQMSPFDGAWPCSLWGSLDPVAVDMVGVDFLTSEFPTMPDVNYSDMYLVEAAQANQPPSGTRYDPEGDGTLLPSLGVAEHWNNARDKQYSRNLDKTGQGIELVYVVKGGE